MRIGIVGPHSSVEIVLAEASKADIPIECMPLAYTHYTEAVRLVTECRPDADAFLFTGATPYKYALQHTQPEELWGVLPHSVNSLLSAMFKAVYLGGHDVRRLSVDSYDEEALHGAYAAAGLAGSEIAVIAHKFQAGSPGYVEKLVQFHRGNLESGRATFCLTGVQNVYDALKNEGLPVTKIFATPEIIVQQLQKLYLQYRLEVSKEHRVIVISVHIGFSQERSLYGKSDMQFFLYRTRAMGEAYAFAQRIGAAIEVHGNESCRIYSTEAIVETETRGFTELPLLRDLLKAEGVTIAAAGIGMGKDPADARYHADLGRDRAMKTGRSGFFIVHDDHRVVGPILDSPRKKQKILVDRGLNQVSRRTGIGLERLHQLERAIRLHGIDSATPGELAALCNMSLCNMNRILAKLEREGFARVIGKQPSRPLGRPSRLVQVLL